MRHIVEYEPHNSMLNKLNHVLTFEHAEHNTLTVVALGGLSETIRQLWWHSEESFAIVPSVQLQDALALQAHYFWQANRNNPELYSALSEHVQACFSDTLYYRDDLELHLRYPELPLIKFWLASTSCCCRTLPIEQDKLWLQHLQLTQSLCLAIELNQCEPNLCIGYHEHAVAVLYQEENTLVLITPSPFPPFLCGDVLVLFFPYLSCSLEDDDNKREIFVCHNKEVTQ